MRKILGILSPREIGRVNMTDMTPAIETEITIAAEHMLMIGLCFLHAVSNGCISLCNQTPAVM